MYVFWMIKIADRRVLWRHFRSTSGFIGCWNKFSQKFLLHQKIRRKISGGVLWGIFHLWLHLMGVIIDFDPYVSFLTNKSATVNKTEFHPTPCDYYQIIVLGMFKYKDVYATRNHFGNRSTQNGDEIEMNSDPVFQTSNSLLGRFSISILSCYFYILSLIFQN